MTDHPITPPSELVRHWSRFQGDTDFEALWFRIANEAAQWGADQELEACCEWVRSMFGGHPTWADELLADRRPKPPSLKEQALEELEQLRGDANSMGMGFDAPAIRRALEALPND